jgi:putative ABC transport system ATP-binding protein
VSIAAPPVAVGCRTIVKDFGDGDTRLRVLNGVNLTVHEGEMTLLVGPSGCGKTTLISIIAGVLDPTEGEVELFGTVQSSLSARERIASRARNIGFIFQNFNLLPALSAVENVAIPLLIARWPREKALARAAEFIDAVELSSRARNRPAQLSGGQQQRVAIARALVHEPKLLVCDEPTAALDAHTGRVVMELIKRVAVQPGRAVIVVTHDSRVFSFGDRIAHMADGLIERVEEIASPDGNNTRAHGEH